MTHSTSLRRFDSAAIEPERTAPLPAGHPALSEGRTIYKATVTASAASPRFLVSGHNNPKLGKAVTKGPRKGWPIFHLALEERATCPRSCLQWDSCYGNSMPFSRRHTPDAEFERFLIAEVITLARQHPEGLLVRLHSLGDFYSAEYVYIWASLISQFPQLHVFGYTARLLDDPDPESRRIARAINILTEGAWERFAIRTSGGIEERSTTLVADTERDAEAMAADGIIMCPAQTKATEACATCGLCWAEGARDKSIGFLRHGRKLATGKRRISAPPPEPRPATVEAPNAAEIIPFGHQPVFSPPGPRAAQLLDFLTRESERQGADGVCVTYAAAAKGSGVPAGSIPFAIYELEKRGLVKPERPGKGSVGTTLRLLQGGTAQPELSTVAAPPVELAPRRAKVGKPPVSAARAVFFASARRLRVDQSEVRRLHRKGVGAQNIAQMLGACMEDVRRIIADAEAAA